MVTGHQRHVLGELRPGRAPLDVVGSEADLPGRKLEYLRAVADAALDGRLDGATLQRADPVRSVAELAHIHGIGPFAAELVERYGAATALRGALDRALRPLELTVPQYSCLEVLDQHPGLSNSELARATFVTRQTMNEVLRGLAERELLTRAATATSGRSRPTELTPAGRDALHAASAVVASVEQRMVADLPPDRRARLLEDLQHCVRALA